MRRSTLTSPSGRPTPRRPFGLRPKKLRARGVIRVTRAGFFYDYSSAQNHNATLEQVVLLVYISEKAPRRISLVC